MHNKEEFKNSMELNTTNAGGNLELNYNQSDNLFVANLNSVSLENSVKSKLEILFKQREESDVQINGLYSIVMEQVEKPLIELSLRSFKGNQVKTAQMLGINRNTLKKKIDNYQIKAKNK